MMEDMIPASGFFLHHGNDLPALAEALAAGLSQAGDADFLEPECILIPQPGMRRWLQHSLAAHCGVAANLDFQLPGQFLDALLRPWLPAHAPGQVLDAGHLHWRLFGLLQDQDTLAHPALARLRPYLDGNDPALRAWQLAGSLGQAYEKYQAWRRDWLLSWHAAPDRRDWQSVLWHLASQGRVFRAQAVAAYFAAYARGDCPRPQSLPARLQVFACQNLSPDVLAVLQSLARWCRVDFYLHNPCREFWGDLARRNAAMADPQDNALLQQWGQAGREFNNLLLSEQNAHWLGEQELYREHDTPGTLLQAVQQSVLERGNLADIHWPLARIAQDDSLQIHCCAGPLREVQMLRGQILALLRKDPGLHWRDIAIMAPDPARYAPYFAAVFGETGDGHPALPFRLAESGDADDNGLSALFGRLLALPQSRLTASEGFDLLSQPLLARRLDLDADDLDRIQTWLEQAGVRWGLDAAHRAQAENLPQYEFTWQFALDRLLAGYASTEALVDGVAPLPLPAGQDQRLLDALLGFTDWIGELRARLQQQHAIAQWQDLLQELLANLMTGQVLDDADAAFATQLGAVLAQLPAQAALAGNVPALTLSVIRAGLQEALAPRLGQVWLSGRISIGRMVPMRLMPFKVICLLGLEENRFPRPAADAAINRLLDPDTPRLPGDRDTRLDDRYLMLQLLSACQQHWLLSYSGRDPLDGTRHPPSVVLQELLQALLSASREGAAALAAGDHACWQTLLQQLVIQHPIHAHEPVTDARIVQLVQPASVAAAAPMRPALLAPIIGLADAAPADIIEPEVTLADLLRFWKNPAEYLARQQQVRWQPDAADLPEHEPLGKANGLENYQLSQALDAAISAKPDGNPADWRQCLQAQGLLAPGRAGEARFNHVYRAIAPALAGLRTARRPPRHIDIHLPGAHGTLTGVLRQEYDFGPALLALHKSASELKEKWLVQGRIQALAARALGLDTVTGIYCRDGFVPVTLPCSAEQAAAHLDTLMRGFQLGQRQLLCFDAQHSLAWFKACHAQPGTDAAGWINGQLAKRTFGQREFDVIDWLTQGEGFLAGIAQREPAAFAETARQVCHALELAP